ncbi:mandelate racemase/muconate lactonizing enzyme family protein [Ruania zhangjianzhongii]|uniref:mandelate racemase/muconate lactonizing enzyme family protein n=1 Tax=Ruania zhangjianzhongii TaxID=2603206 RepID=UPI0011CABB18|nr:mandelate racemase/muconate lactonizing enzyme family protein [Ruania zhangjianzhongii]
MKIDRIRTLRLEEFPNLLYVLIDTDEGVTGLGETFIGAEAVESYIHETAAPKLLDEDPLTIEAHARRLRDVLGRNGAGVESRGSSAIDIGLWDLFGKVVGQPLYQVLGGKVRDQVRMYNTCAGYGYVRGAGTGVGSGNWGLPTGEPAGPYEDLQAFLTNAGELAQSLLDQGITAMKIWPFDQAAEENHGQFITAAQLKVGLEPLRLIREQVGDAMDVMLEFHSFWNTPAALRIVKAADEYDPFWYEDLLPAYETEGLRRVADRTATPLTLSETMAGLVNFEHLFASGAAAIAMVDVGWVGGVTAAKRVGNLAEAHSLPIAPHDCTGPIVLATSTHLSCHLPNGFIQETVRAFYTSWYRDLVTELPRIENGMIAPPEGPGHGMELNPEVLTRADATVRTSAL